MHRILAFASALAAAAHASANVVTLTLDPATPLVNRGAFTVSSETPFGPVNFSDTSDASGTIDLDVTFAADGVTPTALQFLGSTDLAFTDVSIVQNNVPVASSTDMGGTITSPLLPVGFGGVFDMVGATLLLNRGTLRFLGNDPATDQLSDFPIAITLEPGNPGTITFSGGELLLAVANYSGFIEYNPGVNLIASGNLQARGPVPIPEPAAVAGLALGGLVTLRRRSR